ncbi:MAG: alpha/beta hydrolase [Polyangiales bacterium]
MRSSVFCFFALAACSSKSAEAPGPSPSTYVPPPDRVVVESGIVREIVPIEGVPAPKNPTLDVETPKENNAFRVVRYRVDPPKPARAIVIAMPGFLGGAGSFDPMARALVRRSDADGAIEVWAIDRRANLLEDTHGDDVAEVRGDPDLARTYYFDGEEVEGKTFHGFLDFSEVGFESEWGAETTLGDLRKAIAKVPDPKAHVVLLGHSMGATLAEAYAAWDFSGARGYDELAGVVLVDGVSGRELDGPDTFAEKDYLEGSTAMGNPFASSGLNVIRKAQPYVALPFLGVKVLEHAERMAIATHLSPKSPRLPHDDVTSSVAILLGLKQDAIPPMTNKAAFGFAFDDASSAITIAAVSAGSSTGGPTEKYKALLGAELIHPSSATASYDWLDFDQTTPKERTRLDDLSKSWFEGPGLNFGEWYFPARLSLDSGVVGSLNIADDDWRAKYGLHAKHGADIDLPFLCFAAALTVDATRYDKLKAMLTKPIGDGRPLAGTARTDPRTFSVLVHPEFTHIDPLQAADVGDGKVWYDALADFVKANTKKGGVTVP